MAQQGSDRGKGRTAVVQTENQPLVTSVTFGLSQPAPSFSTQRETESDAQREDNRSEIGLEDDRCSWKELKVWAEENLRATSQAKMLIMAEHNEMDLRTATSKYVVIRRLLDDELKEER